MLKNTVISLSRHFVLRRFVGGALVFLMVALWGLMAPAAAPQPAWLEPTAPLRVVFCTQTEDDAFMLVRLPARLGAACVADVRAWRNNERRPVRVVWAEAEDVYVLVDCQGASAGATFVLYALAGPRLVTVNPDGPVDPTPVRVMARRAFGQDPPMNADQLHMMEARASPENKVFAVEDFNRVLVSAEAGRSGDGNWEKYSKLVSLSTWLLVPSDGRWVFTLNGDNAAWLRIDENMAAEQTYSRGRDQWLGGKPMELKRGLHRLMIDTVSMARSGYSLSVAWRRTDAAQGSKYDLTRITGGALAEGRIERRDGDLHAFAQAIRGMSYRFIGCPVVFVPVKLRSASVSWSRSSLNCAWQDVAGRSLGVGTELDTVLSGDGRHVPVKLSISDASGHVATDTTEVATDRIPAVEYGVSSRMQGVPAFCYGEDMVLPELHLRATSPDTITFDIVASIEFASGPPTNICGRIRLLRSWGRLMLPAGRADTFHAIRWRVLHGGETVQTGAWVFDAAPFDTMPEAVDGDALRRAGESVTFIARRASAGDVHRVAGLQAPEQRLLLLDGFLSSSEFAADRIAVSELDRLLAYGLPGGKCVQYQRVNLRAFESDSEVAGVARLIPYTQINALLPADMVVLAPSLDSLHAGETLEAFERSLAAMAGLICGPGKSNLMLVVPPVFDVLSGCGCVPDPDGRPCPHARDGRAFAEAIIRVADAYGLPVADLYTSFTTTVSLDPLVRNGSLTPLGIEQAARVLRRAIYGNNGNGD